MLYIWDCQVNFFCCAACGHRGVVSGTGEGRESLLVSVGWAFGARINKAFDGVAGVLSILLKTEKDFLG